MKKILIKINFDEEDFSEEDSSEGNSYEKIKYYQKLLDYRKIII